MFYVGAAAAAPRSIPWDCSDWQESPAIADADDARVSLILESLAANRGKSIYCAIDQSDTWTKAETWAAGRHHNERDDTVYFGQQGNFRGFLAAQEGYLTDGESGVTGVSRELIFEFPREERRRRTIIKRLRLNGERVSHPTNNYIAASSLSSSQPAENLYRDHDNASDTAILSARGNWCEHGSVGGSWNSGAGVEVRCTIPEGAINWAALAQPLAEAECRARGYPRLRAAITIVDPGPPDGSLEQGYGHWEYDVQPESGNYRISARQFRLYSATCQKKIRKRR